MSFVSLSGKYHRDKKSPSTGAEDLGDRHWKTAFSDSGWRHLTMDCAQGLARQCGSCTGTGCTELLLRCIFGKIWPKCKNSIFYNPNLSLSHGREVGNGCATFSMHFKCSGWCGTRAWRYPTPAQTPRHFTTHLTESPTVL